MFLISAPFLFVFFSVIFQKSYQFSFDSTSKRGNYVFTLTPFIFPPYINRGTRNLLVFLVFRIAGFILKFLMMFSALKLQLVSLCRYTPNNFSRSPFNFYNSMQLKILGRHLHFLKILQISIYSKPIFFCTHKLPFLGFINIFRKKSSIKKFKSNN